jgi:hypothetical protein
MKFVFKDRDGLVEHPPREFGSLEEFVEWAVDVDLPRFQFIPYGSKAPSRSGRRLNDTGHCMIWIMSDYD